MARQLPEPGTYQARRSAAIVVREEESGALMAYIPYALCGEIQFSGNHALCLGAKDGTVQRKNFETMKKVFPAWSGENPFELEDIEIPEGGEPEFELADCFHEDYEDKETGETKQSFKAQWFNPLGGGLPSKEPMDEAGKKKTLTKWGGKFKALAKAAPATKTATSKKVEEPEEEVEDEKPAKSGPPKKSAPPGRKSNSAAARTSTLDEVWQGLKKQSPKKSDDELGIPFWEAAEEVAPGSNGELTPTQWGEVADKLEV